MKKILFTLTSLLLLNVSLAQDAYESYQDSNLLETGEQGDFAPSRDYPESEYEGVLLEEQQEDQNNAYLLENIAPEEGDEQYLEY